MDGQTMSWSLLQSSDELQIQLLRLYRFLTTRDTFHIVFTLSLGTVIIAAWEKL